MKTAIFLVFLKNFARYLKDCKVSDTDIIIIIAVIIIIIGIVNIYIKSKKKKREISANKPR